MDTIKEALKKIRKNTSSNTTPITRTEKGIVADQKDELSLSDRLLIDIFLTHLNKERTEGYLNSQSANARKKLIMADTYASEFGANGLYKFLDQPIHINSWTAFLTSALRKRTDRFLNRLYRDPLLSGKNVQKDIAESVLCQYVELDFSAYMGRIRMPDLNLVVICDNLLRIAPAFSEVSDLRGKIRNKRRQLTDLLNSYNIDIKKEGLNSLYLLDGIRELK